MHIGPVITIVATTLLGTAALASDVRLLSFPDIVIGVWAPSADACRGSGEGKIDIAARTYRTFDETCDISWITVTASRDGPVYSARSMCTPTKTGQKSPPSYLLVSPRPDNMLVARQTDANPEGKLTTYQKCS